jgi:acyl dehydratase
MSGRWFEEFEVGQTITHAIRRTVTESDNVTFSCLTMNPQPLHLDAEFSAGTEFGERLVNSFFTLALVAGITVYETTLGTTVANLALTGAEFPAPVRHGDTLRATTEVISVRESRSRPGTGIVGFRHIGLNQHDEVVVRCERVALMHKRAAA